VRHSLPHLHPAEAPVSSASSRWPARHVPPEEFAQLKQEALDLGFAHVESGPLARSSYHAEGQLELIRRRAQRVPVSPA
jgi:lipoate synthase